MVAVDLFFDGTIPWAVALMPRTTMGHVFVARLRLINVKFNIKLIVYITG